MAFDFKPPSSQGPLHTTQEASAANLQQLRTRHTMWQQDHGNPRAAELSETQPSLDGALGHLKYLTDTSRDSAGSGQGHQ